MRFEEHKSVYRSSDMPFLNSKCLFVEFMDMMAIPWFNAVRLTSTLSATKDIYTFNEFNPTDVGESLEWYVNRRSRNVFDSLEIKPGVKLEEGFSENFLKHVESIDKHMFLAAPRLGPHYVIDRLIRDNKGNVLKKDAMVGKVVIYTENNIPFINEYIENFFGKTSIIEYQYGKFEDIISDIQTDSTYMLSDITKVMKLKMCGKLKFSSLILAGNYRYNMYDKDTPILNIDELRKEIVFKSDFIDVFSGVPKTQDE